MNTDKTETVRSLSLDEIEGVAGAKAAEPATTGNPASAIAAASPENDGAVAAEGKPEFRVPLRRFLSMRI